MKQDKTTRRILQKPDQWKGRGGARRFSLGRCVAAYFLGVQCALLAGDDQSTNQPVRPERSGRVVLQLPWRHNFQFAGYYMAKEKGYYREAGFDVELLERRNNRCMIEQVVSGQADYGVSSRLPEAILLDAPVVALSAVLQHSPVVIVATERSGIRTPQDLAGKRVMMSGGPVSFEVRSMLHAHGVSMDQIVIVPHEQTVDALIDGRVDACIGNLADEPVELQKRGIRYVMFTPEEEGGESYSQVLFTSRKREKSSPVRVQAFRDASMRGWSYAMTHVDETIDTIIRLYAPGSDRGKLEHESVILRGLMAQELVQIGYINPARWERKLRRLAEILQGTADGLTQETIDRSLFDDSDAHPARWWVRTLLIGLVVVACAMVFFGMVTLSFRHIVRQRTAALSEANQKLALETARLTQSEWLLGLQRDFAVSVSAATTLKACYEQAFDFILRIPGVDCCGVYRRQEATGSFALEAHSGFIDAFAKTYSAYDNTMPHLQDILTGRAVWFSSELLSQGFGPVMQAEGLLCAFVVPVRFESEVVAALHVASHATAELPPHTLATIESLAMQMGSAITRLKTQEDLQASEVNYRSLVENSMDVIVIINLDGDLRFANRQFEILSGYTQAELCSQPLGACSVIPSRVWQNILEDLSLPMEDGAAPRYEAEFLTKIGKPVSVEFAISRTAWHDEPCVLVTAHDISDKHKAELVLQESERLFRSVAEGAFDGLALLDQSGCYIYANMQFLQMIGYSAGELHGASFAQLLSVHEQKVLVQRFKDRRAGIPVPSRYELVFRRKGGDVVPVEVSIKEIVWHGEQAFVAVYRDISERRRLQMEILKIHEWERTRIGQDLHDTIGQQLVGMAYLLGVLAQNLDKEQSVHAGTAAQLSEIGRNAHQQLRDVVQGLLPLVAEEALGVGLKRLCDQVRERMGISCELRDTLARQVHEVGNAHHIYYIAQEAVANAVRHGNAKTIVITLAMEGRHGLLQIDDDGCGFDMDGQRATGSGLRIMRYRADVLGGTLSVCRRDAAGMSVHCTFDLSPSLVNKKTNGETVI